MKSLQQITYKSTADQSGFIKQIEAQIVQNILGDVPMYNVDTNPNSLAFYCTNEQHKEIQNAVNNCLNIIMPYCKIYAIKLAAIHLRRLKKMQANIFWLIGFFYEFLDLVDII